MIYVFLAWAIFVALVYLLMWFDHVTHKHSIVEGFHNIIESFGEE